MRSLYINDVDVCAAYGLRLLHMCEQLPKRRDNEVTVPGRHGTVDMTAVHGFVPYGTRTCEYVLEGGAVSRDLCALNGLACTLHVGDASPLNGWLDIELDPIDFAHTRYKLTLTAQPFRADGGF